MDGVDLEKNNVMGRNPSRKGGRGALEVEEFPDILCESPSPKLKAKTVGGLQTEAYEAVVAELKSVIVDANRREENEKEKAQERNKKSSVPPLRPPPPSPNLVSALPGTSNSSTTLKPAAAAPLVKKPSISRKPSENAARHKINQEANFPGFEKLKGLKSVSMSLDWINFKIKSEESGEELFQAVQSKYCSLSVTGRNELFVRKINAENVLRIHSSVEEDLRNFNFYTLSEKHVGTVSCNVRQTFKVPSTIKNKISGKTYNVSAQHEGENKIWQIEDAGELDKLIASVKVVLGHRWKSIYTLTFIEETSISSQILLVGFLLALASARLESELVPAFFAFFAVVLTFIIFFIIQFT